MNSAAAVAAAPEQVWGRFANGAISNSMVMRGSLGQRRRHFRKLIIPKIKATGNDVQVLPLNETEHLELVKKSYHPWCLTSSAGQYAKSVDASGLLRSRDGLPKQRQRRRTSD
jgi:hypothetical protein